MAEWTNDEELRFTIEYALFKAKQPARRSKAETREQRRRRRKIIAEQIVEHIKLSNWRIEKGPVPQEHLTDWKSEADKGEE